LRRASEEQQHDAVLLIALASRIFDKALTRPGVRDNATDGQTTPHTEEPVMAAAKKTAKKTAKKASTKKAGAKKTKK
jgi:hypothetical protein